MPRSSTRSARTARPVAPFELALAIVVLFLMARSPVLFFRLRAGAAVGGPLATFWQDDPVIRGVILAGQLAVLLVALRVCGVASLRRQWPLLAFLAFVVLSTAWSVEPDVTGFRAAMFVGAAAVGWYLGERFRVEDQALIVAGTAALGALASVVALLVWPDLARATNGVPGWWSGVYVNRNLLGAVLAFGLLSFPFLVGRARRWMLLAACAVAVLEAYLFWRSGSRTGLVALLAAVGVQGMVAIVRVLRRHGVTVRGGAVASGLVGAAAGFALHHNWDTVLGWFGRDATLTRRTTMWAIDRHFLAQRPVGGWGFEAIWTHQPVIQEARVAFRSEPLQAHNGYLEILLGVGRLGFALFLVFLAVTAWRVFAYAWHERGIEGLWPIGLVAFVLVINFSESFYVAGEAQWALLVAAGVAATRRPERPVRSP